MADRLLSNDEQWFEATRSYAESRRRMQNRKLSLNDSWVRAVSEHPGTQTMTRMAAAAQQIGKVMTQVPKVYGAIASVIADLAQQGIGKNQTNTFDNYKFRGIDDLYNALGPALARHKLIILPSVIERTEELRQVKSGGTHSHVLVQVQFEFISAEDGSKHQIVTFGEALDRSDKATPKAMTAAFKYACFEVFCIPVQGDDADASSPHVEGKVETQHDFTDDEILLMKSLAIQEANAPKNRLPDGAPDMISFANRLSADKTEGRRLRAVYEHCKADTDFRKELFAALKESRDKYQESLDVAHQGQ